MSTAKDHSFVGCIFWLTMVSCFVKVGFILGSTNALSDEAARSDDEFRMFSDDPQISEWFTLHDQQVTEAQTVVDRLLSSGGEAEREELKRLVAEALKFEGRLLISWNAFCSERGETSLVMPSELQNLKLPEDLVQFAEWER